MLKVLKFLKEQNILSEFYDVRNPNGSCVGYVVDYDEEFYLIEAVGHDGRYNGLQLRVTDDIIKIQRDTSYLEALEKLMPYYNYSHADFDGEGKTVLDLTLDYCRKNKKICSVAVSGEDCYISGYIADIAEGIAVFERINSKGESDGAGYIRVEDIEYVSVDSEDEIRTEILSKQAE